MKKRISILLFSALAFIACEKEDEQPEVKQETPEQKEDNKPTQSNPDGTVWDGQQITFTYSSSTPVDKISTKVSLTRAKAGQIYNAVSESSADKNLSPKGTKWAEGKASNWKTLKFDTFRKTVKPKDVVGKDLVLFLEEEKIYLDIKFTKWDSGKESAGFGYTRSTKK